MPVYREPLENSDMQQHSVFVADCLCGRQFPGSSREYVCPACSGYIVLEWDCHPGPRSEGFDKELSDPEAMA